MRRAQRVPAFSRDACGQCDSHAKVRATHRRNRFRRPAHLDLRRALAPKEIQQQLPRRPTDQSRRRTGSNPHPLTTRPLDLEPAPPQPPAQKPPAAAHVSPQPGIYRRPQAANPQPIRAPHVLVMNEELVEVRHLPHPRDTKEPDRRAGPDPGDQPGKVRAPGQSGATPLGEPREGTGQHHAGTGDEIVFTQHQVSGQIVTGPPVEQGGNGRAELVEKIAQRSALGSI